MQRDLPQQKLRAIRVKMLVRQLVIALAFARL